MGKGYEYLSNGVSITPSFPSTQDVIEIRYDGLLPKNGATEVYAHVSFDDSWNNVYDYKMSKRWDSFVTSVHLPRNAEAINFCFRDTANNWDNNAGQNYSVDVNKDYYANRFDSDLGKAVNKQKEDYFDEDEFYAMRAGSEWC